LIVVECYLDEYLIRSLGFPKRLIKHQSGKGKVLRSLHRLQGKIGIIDEDPDSLQPPELMHYDVMVASENLKLFRRRSSNEQYLIVISPYLEGWIIRRATYNHINLNEYGLESDANSLHNIPHIEEKLNFRRFLSHLINNDEEIELLKTWLSEYL